MSGDHVKHVFPGFGVIGFFHPACEVEIVPADDAVFDELVAGFGDLLFFLLGLGKLARVADGDGTGEAAGKLDLIDGLIPLIDAAAKMLDDSSASSE